MQQTSPHPTLVIASRNAKKKAEIYALLAPHLINVQNVADYPDVPEIEEDGKTFGENAAKKATVTARVTNQWALGEDSGLMVEVLDGKPGIYSARYSGPDATDEKNNQKLIAELSQIPSENRAAKYVCHVAVAAPSGEVRLRIEDFCCGIVVDDARGHNGFGYDPHFFIPEYHKTFGELGSAVKQTLSHRARAFRRLIKPLVTLLTQN